MGFKSARLAPCGAWQQRFVEVRQLMLPQGSKLDGATRPAGSSLMQ